MEPKTRVIELEELSSLIPHQGKMRLLSRLVAYDLEARTLTAEYDVTEDCIFYDPGLGGIPSWVGFELMAQSISALSGLIGRSQGQKPRPGFILSVSNLILNLRILPKGRVVTIRVQEDCRVDLVFTFTCELLLGDEPGGSAKLTVMESDEILKKQTGIGGAV